MTTNYHTAIATGAPADAATFNVAYEGLDAELTQLNGLKRFSAVDFYAVFNSPIRGTLGNTPSARLTSTWRLFDNTDPILGTTFEYNGVKSGTQIQVDIFYAMATAISGVLVLEVSIAVVAVGSSFLVFPAIANPGIAIPSVAGNLGKDTLILNVAYQPSSLIRLNVSRFGTAGNDTAVGDCHFIAATVRFL